MIGGIAYPIPAKGEKMMARWACRIIAKHLADKILQEQYKIPNTNVDTPIRKKVLSEILIEEAEEHGIKITPEEANASIEAEQLKAQNLAQTEHDPFHKSKQRGRPRKITPPSA